MLWIPFMIIEFIQVTSLFYAYPCICLICLLAEVWALNNFILNVHSFTLVIFSLCNPKQQYD